MPPISKAEKQRLYRLKRDADPHRRQLYLEQRKDKYQADKKDGKRKMVESMTQREKRKQRKVWKIQQRHSRARRRQLKNIVTPPQSPTELPMHLTSSRQHKQGRRQVARDKAAVYRRNKKLQEDLERKCKEISKFKMRYSRLKSQIGMSTSPRSKANRLLRYLNNGGSRSNMKDEGIVKRSLTLHFALLSTLREQYQTTKGYRQKQQFKRMISGKIITKYKLKSVVAKELGWHKRIVSSTNNKRNGFLQRRDEVRHFFCRDDVSRIAPGKKNTITVKKVKKQRRLLTDSMKNLHLKYLSETVHPLCYSVFCKLRPFWVVWPKEQDRETCLCIVHENFQLIVNSLYSCGILKTKDLNDIANSVVCSENSKECAYNNCENCKLKSYEVSRMPNSDASIAFSQWIREKVYRQVKDNSETIGFIVTKKSTKELSEDKVVELFESALLKFKRHVFNIRWQFHMYRRFRQTLKPNECLLHVDFSEDYQCRYSSEIQSVHFGASHNHACLHTGVFYIHTSENAIPFCTISDSTRHDPAAIWAHLDPVLDMLRKCHPSITTLHFFSDSLSTQYRQKGNFHFLSTEPFEKGFEQVTWNFFEAGHGKGAPDGVGGSLKRTADSLSRLGLDITDALTLYTELVSQTSVQLFYVDSTEVKVKSEKLASVGSLQPVPGTMQLHQVISLSSGYLKVRAVSCSCSKDEGKLNCPCFNLRDARVIKRVDEESVGDYTEHSFQRPVTITNEDIGKWCIVDYDNQAYPGIITDAVDGELQVKAMHSVGQNRFFWPSPRDDVNWYPVVKFLCFIQEPTYASRRHVMIDKDIWKKIQSSLD